MVGARPQFVKAAAVSRAITAHNAACPEQVVEEVVVHTGQHYDREASDDQFADLGLDRPAVVLRVGSASHGVQTGTMLVRLEPVLQSVQPDVVVVYGDTNSTLAGALAAAKLGLAVAHVESGLRSRRRDMPEEINRVVTDQLSTLRFCSSATGATNLAAEGLVAGVEVVGDVMHDVLRWAVAAGGPVADVGARTALRRGDRPPGGEHRRPRPPACHPRWPRPACLRRFADRPSPPSAYRGGPGAMFAPSGRGGGSPHCATAR